MLGRNKNSAYADDGKDKVSTLIGKETTFDGDLTSAETVRIDGVINGNCSCEKKLILSAEGQVKGNITAQSVIISGGWTVTSRSRENWNSSPQERSRETSRRVPLSSTRERRSTEGVRCRRLHRETCLRTRRKKDKSENCHGSVGICGSFWFAARLRMRSTNAGHRYRK